MLNLISSPIFVVVFFQLVNKCFPIRSLKCTNLPQKKPITVFCKIMIDERPIFPLFFQTVQINALMIGKNQVE